MMIIVSAQEMRNHCSSNLELQYRAHMEELESAVYALLAGDEFEFTFDLTSADKQYLNMRLRSILGSEFSLDFH